MVKHTYMDFPRYQIGKIIPSFFDQPEFKQSLENYAKTINAPIKDLEAKAKQIFLEISSNYKPSAIRFAEFSITTLHRLFFNQMIAYGHLNQIPKDRSVIYLPVHRSHTDYLFLSYMLYKQGLVSPHIAAGVNLSFFPMGSIFRRMGAFFIRRKISGNVLYLLCLKTYIHWLMNFPLSIELYLEGGRSRDGRIRKAQTGIFQLMLENLDHFEKYCIVPVSIGYDFTPEVASFAKEEQGLPKKKESLMSIFKSLNRMDRFYDVHFHFLKPIMLNDWIQKDELSKPKLKDLSGHILEETQYHTVITPYQIMAASILSFKDQIFEDELYQYCLLIRNYLQSQGHLLSDQAIAFEKNFPLILDHIISKNWLSKKESFSYQIVTENRVRMNYYKNSILHFFIPTLLSSIQPSETIVSLLNHEFQTLHPKFLKNVQADSLISKIASSILDPYIFLLFQNEKNQTDPPTLSSIDLTKTHVINENLTHQKLKNAHAWLGKQSNDNLSALRELLQPLV